MPRHVARGVCFDDLRKPPKERSIVLIFERSRSPLLETAELR